MARLWSVVSEYPMCIKQHVRQTRTYSGHACRDRLLEIPRQAAAGWDRGRVRERQDVTFTGMHLLRRPLKKIEIFQNLEKKFECKVFQILLVLCAFWTISSIFWFFENFEIFQNSTNSCLAVPVSFGLFLIYSLWRTRFVPDTGSARTYLCMAGLWRAVSWEAEVRVTARGADSDLQRLVGGYTLQAAAGWDRGRVRERQDVTFTETDMHLVRRPLKKIEKFQNFRKIKKFWKMSEKRTKPKKFQNFEKKFECKIFQFLLVVCAFWTIFRIFLFFENFEIFQNSTNSCLAVPVSFGLFLMDCLWRMLSVPNSGSAQSCLYGRALKCRLWVPDVYQTAREADADLQWPCLQRPVVGDTEAGSSWVR
jgi:hypothetical protein